GLVSAEQGYRCDLIELNPFLAWLARAKTRSYTPSELSETRLLAHEVVALARQLPRQTEYWTPPIHQINRWWSATRLAVISRLFQSLQQLGPGTSEAAYDLLRIAFCRVLIDWSNAAFNHQSMSFREATPTLFDTSEEALILDDFVAQAAALARSAETPLAAPVGVYSGDSRHVGQVVSGPYDAIITSPPYPNRMSYIRELRPYMYWLGYLTDGRAAGELDWQAIGGTWGIATSRLQTWRADGTDVDIAGLREIIRQIEKSSTLLANYVHKYFVDIAQHLQSVKPVLSPGADLFYIVGNSKFYDTLVPVEKLYAALMAQAGFEHISIRPLRKRNSKKELVEFCVQARQPA
ncbi:MAG: hypothetical protein NZM11_06655, partial [Anaerolineales bacterium]|nr:hypothetical protein [Anaerolineales bacterium]